MPPDVSLVVRHLAGVWHMAEDEAREKVLTTFMRAVGIMP